MTLARLTLTDFRNHAAARIEAAPGFVVLVGENGAGKTNVLEAVSLLVPGRGLRGAAAAEMARKGGSGAFGIAAELANGTTLSTGTQAAAPDRRLVRINGAAQPATALGEWLSAIWIVPAMDRLFPDAAGERRRFLDRLPLALDPAHARHASRYDAAMRQRNRLLGADDAPDPAWLDALEAQMATHGAALHQARAGLVAGLSARLAAAPDGPFARPLLALEGWSGADDLADALRRGRARDAGAGRTLSGPHRIDLIVSHAAKGEAAARCSTGEQKALLFAIILAHADLVADARGQRPLLLRDEVAAHLDPLRRAALFDQLAARGGQVWMTGTEPSLFAELGGGAQRITVTHGLLNPDGGA